MIKCNNLSITTTHVNIPCHIVVFNTSQVQLFLHSFVVFRMVVPTGKVLYLSITFCAGIYAQLAVNDSCGPLNDMLCVLESNCPEAGDRLKKGDHDTGLERCGWDGLEEIVCCSTVSTFKFRLRPSVEACRNYSKTYSIGSQPFITGGVNASAGEFPYIAALGYKKINGLEGNWSWDCAGVLVSETFILTAAHCLVRPDSETPRIARLGKVDLTGKEDNLEPQDVTIIEIIPHNQYDHATKVNDIALLKLERRVRFTRYVKPVCLHDQWELPTGLVVAGWGHTKSGGDPSRFLLKAFVKPVDLNQCNQTYLASLTKRAIFETQLCANADVFEGSDTCQGDSGGPIQIQNKKNTPETPYVIVGVTSFGRGCGGNTPSVYTRVWSYLSWIESIVWK